MTTDTQTSLIERLIMLIVLALFAYFGITYAVPAVSDVLAGKLNAASQVK
jgi:hypothetical protein